MRSSRFINRVKISKRVNTRTETGAVGDEILEEVITCRAGVESTSVSNELLADKAFGVSSYKIIIRKPSEDIKINYVVEDLDTGMKFDIIYPPKYLDKNRVLELSCEGIV